MENTIKIIAIGKGGYEQGTIDMEVISFEDLDNLPNPHYRVWDIIYKMRERITEQETINAKLKSKKK